LSQEIYTKNRVLDLFGKETFTKIPFSLKQVGIVGAANEENSVCNLTPVVFSVYDYSCSDLLHEPQSAFSRAKQERESERD